MRGRIISVVVLLTMVLSIPGLYFLTINRGLRQSQEDVYEKLNEIIQGNTAYDVLLLGSSRMYAHADPHIIDSVAHVNSYNAGFDGATIVECNLLLNAYLKRHPHPEVVVFNIDFGMMNTQDGLYDVAQFFPYLNEAEVYQALQPMDPSVWVARWLPFVAPLYYNDMKNYLGLKSLLGLRASGQYGQYKGYIGSDDTWNVAAESKLSKRISAKHDPRGEALLEGIVTKCEQKGIKLIFVYAPQYAGMKNVVVNFEAVMSHVRTLAVSHEVPFVRFDNMAICESKDYFYDPTHLNRKGSRIYSDSLAATIVRFAKEGIGK